MRKFVTLECDACQHRFEYFQFNDDDLAPDACPKCGVSSGGELKEMPPQINLKSWRTKSKDQFYRNEEAASEARIEMAAEQTGMSKAELSHLKVTDMNDNMREGDIAWRSGAPVVNDVTRRMDELKSMGAPTGFINNGQAQAVPMAPNDKGMVSLPGTTNAYSAPVHTGIAQAHQQKAAQMQRSGQMYKTYVSEQ